MPGLLNNNPRWEVLNLRSKNLVLGCTDFGVLKYVGDYIDELQFENFLPV